MPGAPSDDPESRSLQENAMHHHRPKISLIGAGNIGGDLAAHCARE